MRCFVNKIEWEYGEKYGHVYHPKSLEDFHSKLHELEEQAIANKSPFYVEIFFADDSYIGLIVGHELSNFYFGVRVPEDGDGSTCRAQFDCHYDEQKEGDDTIITYSFKGDHGEQYLTGLMPKKQAFDALYQYIETRKLPSYIRFTKQEMIDTYIS